MWWVNEVQFSGLRCYDCSDPNQTEPRLQMSWKLWSEVLRVLTNLWPSAQPLTTDSTRNCLHRATTNLNSADPCTVWPNPGGGQFPGQRVRSNDEQYISSVKRSTLEGSLCIQYFTNTVHSARPIPPSTMYFWRIELIRKNREYSTKLFWVIDPSDQPGIVIKIQVVAPELRF